ncbi:hypothetical protein GCM10027277_26860 [Pseudoduganella ginsengisoli]|uniref:DUF3187 family protein n=1 Tax=Pseudoduganella ginsengisoli TaxID=1462440 RepID=A0A6L6Q106_9BURK|nr:hypothetical protein [Pseudoduganella ginsengisoli]MTW03507.1 hypothetical protein [Pseudoduganella ginsengisoli]
MRSAVPSLLCAALAAPALAHDAGVHGYALAGLAQTQSRSTAANPGNLFDMSGGSGELALGLEGGASGVRWRARLTLDGERGKDWPSERKLQLQELHYGWRWGEQWHVAAGQQLLTWDSGLSFQPLGFFKSSQTDLRDVFDTEGRSQGLPMIVATRLGDTVTMDIVASTNNPGNDRAERSNARQLAVRWSGEPTPGLNTALMLRKRAGARIGAGVSASYGVDEVTLRADAYYGPAEARWFPTGLLSDPARLYLPPLPFRYEPGRDYKLRAVAGATWTPQRGLALYGEWVHHGDGIAATEWRRYKQQLVQHTAALGGPYHGAAIGNLGTDASLLGSAPAGVRRDYLYLRAELGQGDATWCLSTFAGLADGSAMTTLSKSWQLRSRLALKADVNVFTGKSGSEFGMTPYRYQGHLVLLHTF